MAMLSMVVNGKPVSLEVDPASLLVDVLREQLGLIGTKVGCGEGECGACTVLVDGEAVVSCLYPALKAEGREITTIEGLGSDGELDIIQQAFLDTSAVQCGYCTPGFVLAVKALLAHNPHPTPQEIEEGLAGNLCRCTGYYQIKEAVELAVARLAARGGAQ
ncbi:MAG TPA: (2Fe-2S)-binding protein [Anaerolineae bacterium]|nr:(2Fe-2S)-binding protein [Anaerolineae bacterium]HOQ99779.1 (2Fe-2S)-binding protein [Anaerolineae bacterium]HPL30663.1 (2Fe-2S)-binding protein [Anaerolineae bacterium]